MVEVGHNDGETLVFFAEEVVDWDFDIVEGDECRPSSGGIRSFNLLKVVSIYRIILLSFELTDTNFCLHSLAALDQQHAESFFCSYGGSEVVRPYSICDPFFRAINNVELPTV